MSGPSWFGCSHRGAGAREDGGGQGQQPCGHACRASSRTLSRGTRGGSYWSPSRPLWPLRLPAADLSPWAPLTLHTYWMGPWGPWSSGSLCFPLREHSPSLPRGSQAPAVPGAMRRPMVTMGNFTYHLTVVPGVAVPSSAPHHPRDRRVLPYSPLHL